MDAKRDNQLDEGQLLDEADQDLIDRELAVLEQIRAIPVPRPDKLIFVPLLLLFILCVGYGLKGEFGWSWACAAGSAVLSLSDAVYERIRLARYLNRVYELADTVPTIAELFQPRWHWWHGFSKIGEPHSKR